MALRGKGKAKNYAVERCEPRLPMQVGLRISGNKATPGVESTFTENVSSRGARVRTVRRWHIGETICVLSPTGNFRSLARIAYCESFPGNGYAVGVEFLELEGQWVLASAAGPPAVA